MTTMNPYANRLARYEDTAVQTSSPEKLVVLLYEGVISFLRQAVTATQSRNIEQKRQSVDRALAVIQHLQSTLGRDRGGGGCAEFPKTHISHTSPPYGGCSKHALRALCEATKNPK